jgi:predicted component of type VI protein secretion system
MSAITLRQRDILDLHKAITSKPLGLNLVDAYSPLPEIFSQDVLQSLKEQGNGADVFLLLLTRRLNQLLDRVSAQQAIIEEWSVGYGAFNIAEKICEAKYGKSNIADVTTYYSGLMPTAIRTAASLKKMLKQLLVRYVRDVEIKQCLGSWISIPKEQRSRLGSAGQYNCLGVNSVAGDAQWNYEQKLAIYLHLKEEVDEAQWQALKNQSGQIKNIINGFVDKTVNLSLQAIINEGLCKQVRLSTENNTARLGNDSWLGRVEKQTKVIL